MAEQLALAYRSSFPQTNLPGIRKVPASNFSLSARSDFSSERTRARNHSFESVDSSIVDYDHGWSLMDEVLRAMASTSKGDIQKDVDQKSTELALETESRQSPMSEEYLDEEKDEAVSVSTQHELEWFERVGLLSQIVDGSDPSNQLEQLELRTLTKSQSDTVRKRMTSLKNTISRSSSHSVLDALSTISHPSQSGSGEDRSESVSVNSKQNKSQWRDVRDVFQRRSSSSSGSQDGEREISPKSSEPSSQDSLDSAAPERRLMKVLHFQKHRSAYVDRPDYCLTQPVEPPEKGKIPTNRWYSPLGGQAAANIVGHDLETGVRCLKINYKVADDLITDQELPPPVPIWPKNKANSDQMSDIQNLQLEFAYQLHPTASPQDDWPDIVLKNAASGICRIDDLLWEGDITSVRQLALIELTSIFDKCHLVISKHRQKTKKKSKNSPEIGVFGSALDRLVVLDNNRRGGAVVIASPNAIVSVPIVFMQMLTYLEEYGGVAEEGLLRISGETNRIRHLRGDLDSYYNNPIPDESSGPFDESQWFRRIFQSVSVHDIASVMKQFLRDLPQPLLTNELVDAFAQISEIRDRLIQIQALNLLVLQLPAVEQATLRALLKFLRKMVVAEKANKMSSANIAMIIAPNLFHPKVSLTSSPPSQNFFAGTSEKRVEDPVKQFNLVAKLSDVTRIMIDYSELLFTVPPSFIRQIRARDSEKFGNIVKEKKLRRLDLRRIQRRKAKVTKVMPALSESDRTESTFFQQDFPREDCTVIRVRLSRKSSNEAEHRKVSTAVQVTPALTAGDVITKFLPTSSLSSTPESLSGSTELHNLSASSGVSGSDKSSSSSNEDLLGIDSFHGRNPQYDRRDTEPPVSHQTHFLIEQGGNIGIRRLDHRTNMLAACKQNPSATWIVKYFPQL